MLTESWPPDAAAFAALARTSLEAKLVHRAFAPLFANEAFADLFLFDSPDEVMARASVLDLMEIETQAAPQRAWRSAIARGRLAFGRSHFYRRDGSPVLAEYVSRPIAWIDGPAQVLGLIDVTNEARALDLLAARLRAAREPTPRATAFRHALVADDNPAALRLLVLYLETLGWRAHPALSGEAAIALAAAQRHDLALIDLNMPGMDGLETARRLRQLQRPWAGAPILAMSAHFGAGLRDAVAEAGLDGFLIKPIERSRLAAQVALFAPAGLSIGATELDHVQQDDEADKAGDEINGGHALPDHDSAGAARARHRAGSP